MLTKVTEAALNAELDDHLGYSKHGESQGDNARNGYDAKTILTDNGKVEIATPRDRDASFLPKIVKKR